MSLPGSGGLQTVAGVKVRLAPARDMEGIMPVPGAVCPGCIRVNKLSPGFRVRLFYGVYRTGKGIALNGDTEGGASPVKLAQRHLSCHHSAAVPHGEDILDLEAEGLLGPAFHRAGTIGP